MTGDTAETPAPARISERHARSLFVATIVTGSFLLFLTQPMVARMALPRLGGAPSVWNSAMLVYQALLLAGYGYAHWLARLRPRRQVGIHIILLGLAALWLPIGLTSALPPTTGEPEFWVPWFLISSIGPVFFIVSAQAPLMQRWYALESSRGDPYPLYAASNLGSFAGLISYPLIVEPLLGLRQQSWLWTGIYALLVLLVAACALTVPGKAVESVPEETEAPPTARRILHWIALAAVPSGLMLSTTTHLTTDIVAIPLLWVLPLGLYLLSFVIAFAERRKLADTITMLAPLVILICGGPVFARGASNPLFAVTLGLVLLLAIAVALHSQLFRLRPAVGHLTKFYLAMSFGGMLGGLFCAIVAPLVFSWAYEHPLLILAAALLVPQYVLVPWPRRWRIALGIAAPLLALGLSFEAGAGMFGSSPLLAMLLSIVISLLALACLGRPWPYVIALGALMLSYGGWTIITHGDARTRSYFGVYEVSDRRDPVTNSVTARVLTHGTTLHGIQNVLPGLETVPTSYYARRSGVGLTLANAFALYGAHPRVGIVGLGSGTLSCYFRPGESWTIFEIDPAMVEVARNRFSFLSRCAPQARIVLGDARISLAHAPRNSLDILAIDAFSADAVPMHLLTREALTTYGRAVQRDGIVLFHISNRYLDLRPVVAQIAHEDGWHMQVMEYVPTDEELTLNATVSVWIALSRNPTTLERLTRLSGADAANWETLTPTPGFSGWSDDHASILPIINWRNLWPGRR